jgi:DNA-binding transcriptional regulator YiaG
MARLFAQVRCEVGESFFSREESCETPPRERAPIMGKMEDALKKEIVRLTKKELRISVNPLSQNLRELKRAVSRLTKMVNQLHKGAEDEPHRRLSEKGQLQAPKDEVKNARVTPRAIKNLRKKLGVSQEKLALLLNVSPGAVAFWEQGRARPRGANKGALVAIRKLGRRDIRRILVEKGLET